MPKEIAKTATQGAQPVYRSKLLQEHIDDSYKLCGIGEAIHHAYQDHLKVQFGHDENLARVHWKR